MGAYKMAAIKITPPNDFPLGLIRPHMVVIHLLLMLCDLQRVVRNLRPILYTEKLIGLVRNNVFLYDDVSERCLFHLYRRVDIHLITDVSEHCSIFIGEWISTK
jgi:hypothetical protein